jgi:hypothetical protein
VDQKPEKKPGRFRRYCERHAFRPGSVIFFAVLLIVILGALGYFGATGTRFFSKTTNLGLKNIGELATQAGYFTSVQTINKSRNIFGIQIPGTQSNYIYSFDGTIKAGIDFQDIKIETDDLRHIIRVTFPEFKILSTEIKDDSFVLYNDGANLFTSLKVQDVQTGNAALKESARETAIRNGILDNARSNAEVLIRGFLAGSYDLTSYTVEFYPKVSE